MPVFVIAYDLNVPGQGYDRLIEQLKKFPNCHAQQSMWFIEAAGPASALRDALRPFHDANDRIFIDRVSNTWAGFNMPSCGKWLNDRGL